MKLFALDVSNNAIVLSRPKGRAGGTTPNSFSTERELAALVSNWPHSRLVTLWNQLPSVKRTKRFATRAIAVRRIWKSLQHLSVFEPNQPRLTRSATGKTANMPHPVQEKKSEIVVALLKRPKGATLQTLMQATGWQAHTVRGFISGHLRGKLQLKIRSLKQDGQRVYAIEG